MKKLICFIAFISFLGADNSNAQCAPNPLYADAGFGLYPDTLTNLPMVDSSPFGYNAVLDVKTFTDTAITLAVSGTNLDLIAYVEAVRINEIQGLPAGFTYIPNQSVWINGGASPNFTPVQGCLSIVASQASVLSLIEANPSGFEIPITIVIDAKISNTNNALANILINNAWLSEISSLGLTPITTLGYKIKYSPGATYPLGLITNLESSGLAGVLNPAAIDFLNLPTGCPSFSYQWYRFNGITSAPSGNSTSGWTIIPGATSSSYDPPTLFQSTTFACFVTPSAGCGTPGWAQGAASFTITSSAGQVNNTLVQQCEIAPVELSFTSAPIGLGNVAYQWYYQNGEVGCPQGSSTFGWQMLSGGNAATASFTPPTAGTYTLACFVNSETGVGLWASGCKVVIQSTFDAQTIIGSTDVVPFTQTPYLVSQITGHTYQWTATGGAIASGQGTNFVNVVWSNTGPYILQLTESDGICSDFSVLELGGVTGIENEDDGGIKIYPNPAKDFVIVESSNQLQGAYEIYDLAGKLLQSGQLNKTNNQSIAFINPHSPGFYLLRLNKSLTYKLLIN
jgi:hypothetical protein